MGSLGFKNLNHTYCILLFPIDFLKKSFVFQYFCITCFNDNGVKKMGEGRSFQVVVSFLPQTKQSFSHSDD